MVYQGRYCFFQNHMEGIRFKVNDVKHITTDFMVDLCCYRRQLKPNYIHK